MKLKLNSIFNSLLFATVIDKQKNETIKMGNVRMKETEISKLIFADNMIVYSSGPKTQGTL